MFAGRPDFPGRAKSAAAPRPPAPRLSVVSGLLRRRRAFRGEAQHCRHGARPVGRARLDGGGPRLAGSPARTRASGARAAFLLLIFPATRLRVLRHPSWTGGFRSHSQKCAVETAIGRNPMLNSDPMSGASIEALSIIFVPSGVLAECAFGERFDARGAGPASVGAAAAPAPAERRARVAGDCALVPVLAESSVNARRRAEKRHSRGLSRCAGRARLRRKMCMGVLWRKN